MTRLIQFGALLALMGCVDSNLYMADSVATVEVDGFNVNVRQNKGDPMIWEASDVAPIRNNLTHGDPAAYRRNIRAIELVSGCNVDRDTLQFVPAVSATVAGVIC